MKKFWEKHDLIKVAGIMVLITVLLTWVIPQGYYNEGFTQGEITRIGLFDFFTYGLLGMYYFTVLVTFLFVLGGFYQVLSKAGGYQKLTEVIAKKFKGKEILFVLLISFITAVLAAVMTEYFVVVAFIPFFITIISKMKLDKLTGFIATFGSVLVGTLGSIYTDKILGQSVQYLGVEYGTYLWSRLALFAVAFIIFSVLTIMHATKAKKNAKAWPYYVSYLVILAAVCAYAYFAKVSLVAGSTGFIIAILVGFLACAVNTILLASLTRESKLVDSKAKNEEINDLFNADDVNKKSTVWPVALFLGLFAIVTILAYLPWDTIFGVEFFVNITDSILTAEILGSPIFSYIFGNVVAFGQWDLFGVQILILITALLIKVTYKIKNSEFITAFGEGFIKSGKLVALLLLSYLILEFTVMFPVVPSIVDWIMNLASKFNVLLGVLSGFFTSLFATEYQYTVSLIGSYLINSYTTVSDQIALLLQSTWGLAMLITPASAILLVGLSYLEITFKDWFKYIWKYLVIMTLVIIVLMLVII